MAIEETGRPDGGVTENAVGTAGDTSSREGSMSTVDQAGDFVEVDGKKVPQADAIDAYRNMARWRTDYSAKGQVLNEREAYLRELGERMAPYEGLAETFQRHGGSEERLKEFVASNRFLYGSDAAPEGATAQPPGNFVARDEFDQYKAMRDEADMDRDISTSWRDFRGGHPEMSRYEDMAVRGAIGMIDPTGKSNTQLLEEGLRMVRAAGQEAGRGRVTDVHNQARINALGHSTEGGGVAAGRRTVNWDHSQHSMEENEAEAKRRLLAGEYGVVP